MPQRHHIISKGVEVLADDLRLSADQAIDFDVVIVGSGYGGSAAAARLSKRYGNRLCLLERGEEFPLGKFPSTIADLPNQIRATVPNTGKSLGNPSALFDMRMSNDFNVLIGNGLGGGSLINAGVMARPVEKIFELTDETEKPTIRRIWPARISLDPKSKHGRFMESAFKRALSAIEPERTPRDRVASDSQVNSVKSDTRTMPQKALAMSRLARGAGLSEQFEHPPIAVTFQTRKNIHGVVQNACIQCGECFSGCNYGAKNTLDRTYLATAFVNNANIYVGVSVTRVEAGGDGTWLIQIAPTNPALRGALSSASVIRAKYVILAAGALGSTEILMRSKGVAGSKALGTRFSGNGDMIAVGADHTVPVNAVVDPQLAARYRRVGPTITSMIDLRDYGKWAGTGRGPVIQELNSPSVLRAVFSELVGNGTFLQQFSEGDASTRASCPTSEPLSIDPKRMGAHQVYAMFGLDDSQGKLASITYKVGDAFVEGGTYVDWSSVRKPPVVNLFTESHAILREMIQDSGMVAEKKNGLLANPLWEPFSPLMASFLFGAKRGPLISVHPLGGCPMADDAKYGVVNEFGQVFKNASGSEVYPSLVVLDGAIIPTSLGINPSLTITALAERALRYLSRQWSKPTADPTFEPRPIPLQTPLTSGTVENSAAVQPSGIVLSERMLGRINLPGKHAQARLSMEIAIGPILDIFQFTNDPQHTLSIQVARMNFYTHGAKHAIQIPVRGSIKFARRIPSDAWQRRLRAIAGTLSNGYLFTQAKKYFFDAKSAGEGASLKDVATLAWRLLSTIGDVREYHYELIVTRDCYAKAGDKHLPGEEKFFSAGDKLIGKKTFNYGFKTNPWLQFTTLELYLQRADSQELMHIGALRTDLTYFANFNTYLIKVFQQGDITTSMANLASLVSFFGRAFLSAHLLTFKTQRYAELPRREFSPQASKPEQLAGIEWNNQHVPHQVNGVRLTHYWGNGQESAASHSKSVMFIHGFGASSNTFSEASQHRTSAVRHFIECGFDVWLVDLRTSNASRYRRKYHSFDDVGDEDIVATFDYIDQWKRTHNPALTVDDRKLSVVAHCIGVAMLAHPLLTGKLKNRIAKLVMTQVGFVVELTAYNYARNALIAGIRQLVGAQYFDTRIWPKQARAATGSKEEPAAPPPLDWLLSSFVYRPSEWWRLSGWWRQPTWLAQYNRMSALYAPLMNIGNMRSSTMQRLHRLIAGVNIKGYSQSLFYSIHRRLTNRHGWVLPSVDAINTNIDFPLLFMSGGDNRVFHPSGAHRSAQLVANAWAQQGTLDNRRKAYACQIPGYGHQDLWLGKNSHKDVLPLISSFLLGHHQHVEVKSPYRHKRTAPPRLPIRTAYASVIGPTIGWLRKSETGYVVRIQFAFDRVAHAPESILCLLDAVPIDKSPIGSPHSVVDRQSDDLPDDRLYYNLGNRVFSRTEARVIKPIQFESLLEPDIAGSVQPTNIAYLEIEIDDSIFSATSGAFLGLQIFLVSIHDNEPVDDSSNVFPLPQGYFDTVEKLKAGDTLALETLAAKEVWDEFCCYLPDEQFLKAVVESGGHVGDLMNGFSRNQTNAEVAALGFPALDKLQQFPAVFLSGRSFAACDLSGTGGNGIPTTDTAASITFAVASCQAPQFLFDREMAGASYRRVAARLDSFLKVQRLRSKFANPGILQMQVPIDSEAFGLKVPEFMLALGDQVYLDAGVTLVGSAAGLSSYEKPYIEWLGNPSVRSVVSRIPVYPMLDDHEFKNNFVPPTTFNPEQLCLEQLYQTYQRKLAPQASADQPWYTLLQGGYPIFVMDTRHEREARTLANFTDAKIVSEKQMDALKKWLQHHKNPSLPLFIASPSVVFPMHSRVFDEFGGDPRYALGEDGWDAYPSSVCDLLEFIAKNAIPNVVFLSGDYHMSCVTLMELTVQGSKEPVNVMSIVSSGSYLPYRAAIESRRDIAFEIEHAALSNEVSYRYRTVESTITSANSIALVMAQRATDEAGATVAVTFDTSEGPLYFSRDLDLSFDFKPQLGSTSAVRRSYSAA